jgi:hypothetical protein
MVQCFWERGKSDMFFLCVLLSLPFHQDSVAIAHTIDLHKQNKHSDASMS